MVSAAKAFSKEPPKRELASLDAIVEDFQWRYKDRLKTDQVIEFCRVAPDFPTAVRRAVEARDANGKHHNHQSKVDITARRKFGATIIALAARGSLDLTDFDRMHDRMDERKPYGIGPVTVYDTAIRIAAYLGIEPNSVYMHAGVRTGFKTLQAALDGYDHDGADKLTDPGLSRLDKIPVAWFPTPLRELKADDVEDILCTYREVFETW